MDTSVRFESMKARHKVRKMHQTHAGEPARRVRVQRAIRQARRAA